MRRDYPFGNALTFFIRDRSRWISNPDAGTVVKGWLRHCKFLSWFALSQRDEADRELRQIALLPNLPVALEVEYLSDVCNLANQFCLWDRMSSAMEKLRRISLDLGYTLGTAQADYFQAVGFYQKADLSARQAGDLNLQAEILNDLGYCYRRLSDNQRAVQLYRESLSIREQTGNLLGQAESLNNIGLVLCHQKKNTEAGAILGKALDIEERIGDKIGAGYTLVNLGFLAGKIDKQQAEEFYRRALAIRLEIGDVLGLAYCYLNLAHLAHGRVDKENACSLLDKSIDAFRKAEDVFGQTEGRLFKVQYLLDYRDSTAAIDEMTRLSSLINENTAESHRVRYQKLQERVE